MFVCSINTDVCKRCFVVVDLVLDNLAINTIVTTAYIPKTTHKGSRKY